MRNVLLPLVWIALALSASWAGAAEKTPVQVLLITGKADLPYHVWQETTASMREILQSRECFEVRVTEEPRGLSQAALQGYDVLLLNYNGPRWPLEVETAIERFVNDGGGLVAVHQAAYGEFFGQVHRDGRWQSGTPDAGWRVFPQMIGATWNPEDIGHARRTVFSVNWKDSSHPVTSELPSSFTANDELYHKLDLMPTVEVLAEARSPAELGGTGRNEPVVWTHRFGDGRVFFTTLGHDALAWHEPGMANLLARGTEWAATGQVSTQPFSREHSLTPRPEIRLLVVTGGHSYPVSFYDMLNSLETVTWTHATNHSEAFSHPITKEYDAILLHDMYETTTEQTRVHLREFVDAGKGILSLHHAIVDYSDWPWWYEEVTGGKYFVSNAPEHSASHYREDEEFLVTIAEGKQDHPILKGISVLWVYDELYKNMYHSPNIEVLMETSHSENDRPVVYIGPHREARVVYIQLGHSDDTMRNPGFRHLVANTIKWIAKKPD